MKFLFLFFVLIGCALALPARTYPKYRNAARYQQPQLTRARRAPVRTMLFHGFYRPHYAQRRTGYEPETAMAAFATGDNVAASSYLGSKFTPTNCFSCLPITEPNSEFIGSPDALNPPTEYDQTQLAGEAPQEQPVPEYVPTDQDQPTDVIPADEVGTEVAKPSRTPKQKPNKRVRPQVEDEDDEDEESFVPSRRRGPFNSLFPIVFGGGYPGVRSGAGAGTPGVTAIANSYSTGKGGVATSHATAYGGAAPASRSSKKKTPVPQPDDDEDEE